MKKLPDDVITVGSQSIRHGHVLVVDDTGAPIRDGLIDDGKPESDNAHYIYVSFKDFDALQQWLDQEHRNKQE